MIDGLIEQAREYQGHKVDFPVKSKDVSFDLLDAGMVVGGASSTKLTMTDHARNQMYAKMEPTIFNIAPDDNEQRRGRKSWKEYMDVCRLAMPTMYALHMNSWLERMDSKLFLRAYDDKCRAVLSSRFAVIDNLEMLEWTKAFMDEETRVYKFRNVHHTPDALRLSVSMSEVSIPGGGRDRGKKEPYAIGADIVTGEIGNYNACVIPYVQNTTCTNSISYPKSDYAVRLRHVGVRENLSRQVTLAIRNALNGCGEILRRLQESLEEPLPKIDDIIADMCKDNGWSQEVGYAIVDGREGEHNLWGLVQGISYAANSVSDPEEQLRMHNIAGATLMAGVVYEEL